MSNLLDQNLHGGLGRAGATAPVVAETGFSSRFELPLAWEPLDLAPPGQAVAAAEQLNAGVLAFLLQGVDLDAGARPADERLVEALAPIRAKLDMIVDMLARLSYRGVELPPRCDVELEETRIAWRSPRPLRADTWWRIAIYFHATFREPVVLFGRVTDAAGDGSGDTYRITADLAPMPERVLADLARVALLAQRRQRSQRAADNGRRGE